MRCLKNLGDPRASPMTNSADVLDAFRRAMCEHGLDPPAEIIVGPPIHRCDAAGAHGKGDGSYILHIDGHPCGGLQNWKDGQGWRPWHYRNGMTRLTLAERAAFRATAQENK
jgi:putative DNA primase/helicase